MLINARSETVTEKKTFAKAFKSTRCVFPTTGFYEWEANKEKFLFTEQDSKAVYLAGFYKRFEDGNRSIILTTGANESMRMIHDRMPVILPRESIDQWILDEEFEESFTEQGMPQLVIQ
nr:SOS response-associated peptidase family protein [Enterococcus plantarum]